jgi:hypothetical protein
MVIRAIVLRVKSQCVSILDYLCESRRKKASDFQKLSEKGKNLIEFNKSP